MKKSLIIFPDSFDIQYGSFKKIFQEKLYIDIKDDIKCRLQLDCDTKKASLTYRLLYVQSFDFNFLDTNFILKSLSKDQLTAITLNGDGEISIFNNRYSFYYSGDIKNILNLCVKKIPIFSNCKDITLSAQGSLNLVGEQIRILTRGESLNDHSQFIIDSFKESRLWTFKDIIH